MGSYAERWEAKRQELADRARELQGQEAPDPDEVVAFLEECHDFPAIPQPAQQEAAERGVGWRLG